MREYWFVYEHYTYITGGGFRKDWVRKGIEIVAKNKTMAIEQFNEQYPDCKIIKIKSYGISLKIP